MPPCLPKTMISGVIRSPRPSMILKLWRKRKKSGVINSDGDESEGAAPSELKGEKGMSMEKHPLLNTSHLVNIKAVGGLNKIEWDDQEGIRIGALNRHRDIYYSPLIQKYCPILAEAASKIATPPIRNAGTIGGNIAHAEPSADFPPSLIALKATLKLVSTGGERKIPIADFFTDYYENVLNQGEVLAEIQIPSLPPRSAGTYLKLDKTTNSIAILGVATVISLDDKGICIDAGIGLGGVASTPLKVGKVKEIL